MTTTIVVAICLGVFVIGVAIGILIRKLAAEAKVGSAKKQAENIIEDAKKDIENERVQMREQLFISRIDSSAIFQTQKNCAQMILSNLLCLI